MFGSRLKILAGICLMGGTLHAQYGAQAGKLSDMGWSQRYQPANISQGDFEKFRYSAFGEGYLGNTDFALAGVFSNHGYITEATKERVLEQMKGATNIGGGYNLDLANVNLRMGDLTLAFGLGTSMNVNARIGNPNTLGLILRGNKPYAGQTVSDDDISIVSSQLRTFSVGAGYDMDGLRLGGRLNIHQGVRNFSTDHVSYSLFTEADGLEVNLDADYALNATASRKGFFDFSGVGASLDLGAAYKINDQMEIDFAANGLGWMSWKGNQVSGDVNVSWEGISVVSLLQDSVPAVIEEQVDSLKAQVFPDTIAHNWGQMTPMLIRLGFNYAISEQGTLGLTLAYSPAMSGAYTPMPFVAASYQHEIVEGLKVGGNAYFGGLDLIGVGAMAKYSIAAGPVKINLLAGSDNLLGIVASNLGRGMSAYGGVGVDF